MAELRMKIYAIRHTSVDVEPGICYGQSNVEVAGTFHQEKANLIRILKGKQIDRVYSSPLYRCHLLAEALFPNHSIEFDERLKELDFGDWELKTWDEIYADPKGKVWMDNYQALPTLNGESYPEMQLRISDFLTVLKTGSCTAVAVVAHAGVIRILKSLIEKVRIDELFETFKPAYGSITEFEL